MNKRETVARSSTYLALSVGAAFLVAGILGIALINQQQKQHALHEAEDRARIILDRNLATHTFFTRELKPRIFALAESGRSRDYFDPTWMSSTYAIRQIDEHFKSLGITDYHYKEFSIDSRNPLNEANPFERAFLEELDKDPERKIRSDVRYFDGKPYFVVMKRGEVVEDGCLKCHGKPENAPAGLIRLYGQERGFGRKVGKTVSAISIHVPLSAAYADADHLSLRLSAILALLILVLYAVQYGLGRRLVFSPMEKVREKALLIAGDERHLGEQIDEPAGREIRELAGAFNKMSSKLRSDRDNLEERVRERTAEIARINEELKTDIAERQRIEEDLKKSEARLRATFDGASIGMGLVDRSGRIVESNQVMENYLGYTKEELGKLYFTDVTHPEDLDEDRANYEEIWKGLRERYQMDKRYLRKDGGVVWGRKVVSIVRGPDGQPDYAINMVEDLTEKKRYEEEVLKGRKLESLGVLAGGIAHDFNNYLTAILGNISLVKMLSAPGERTFERLSEAENAALRAKALSLQLITFSKGGAPVRKTASLTELIEETAGFSLRGSKSKCTFALPADLWSADIDEEQISQVVGSLVLNADQAMPGGGTMEIRAENVLLGDGNLLHAKPGKYVRIRVKDQGVGIPEKNLARIFDPYFTTKAGCSGLGLTTAYSIVAKHDGHLTVESEPGKWTVFTIHLPASEKGAPEEVGEKKVQSNGGKKVLVMDDEEMVRSVAGEMLMALGYEVETARDGREAIEAYIGAKESGTPFHAVLMDLTIPGGMGGEETVRRLLEIDPEVLAIVSSGYSDDPVMANHKEYGFREVIKKPYKIADLAATMRKTLGS